MKNIAVPKSKTKPKPTIFKMLKSDKSIALNDNRNKIVRSARPNKQ